MQLSLLQATDPSLSSWQNLSQILPVQGKCYTFRCRITALCGHKEGNLVTLLRYSTFHNFEAGGVWPSQSGWCLT